MKSQLFLLYLQAKKPLILLMIMLASISLSINLWGNYQAKASKLGAGKVVEVLSGEKFTVERDEKPKTIRLCGISALGDEAKEYLELSIKRGDGKVYWLFRNSRGRH